MDKSQQPPTVAEIETLRASLAIQKKKNQDLLIVLKFTRNVLLTALKTLDEIEKAAGIDV